MKQSRNSALLGILLTSTAVLTLEVVLTRIFSVLMWYHFVFVVISLALLGSGTAGVWLYLMAHRFPAERIHERLTLLALLFALSVVGMFLLYLQIPFEIERISSGPSWSAIGWLALIYMVLATPFLLGGAVIALVISHFSTSVGKVYFFDLFGASMGCLISIAALTSLGGASAVLFTAVLGGLAAVAFSFQARRKGWRLVTLITLALLSGVLISNQLFGWLQVRTRNGYDADHTIVYEKWNALSRVTVYQDPHWLQPFGWGLSSTYKGPDPGHLMVLIDSKAGTPIQKWDNDWAAIDFLRYDLTSLAYNVLPEPKVFIIGPGGGRDVLTALLFGAREVTGVELNPAIIDAAQNRFGDYAGRVYNHPRVRVEIQDARTYLARSDEQFDLIQASLIDTWAASSAGAFALSENGLYTREAFLTYYDRLSERGIVSFSRWYFIQDPAETLRLVALGLDGWRRSGVSDPASHIMVVANMAQNRSATEGLATMLLKKTPFTPEEVAWLAAKSKELDFSILYGPGLSTQNPVSALITAPDPDEALSSHPLNLSPPTDDRPFFFNFVRPGDMISPAYKDSPVYQASAEANQLLLAVLGISLTFTVLFMLAPMAWRRSGELRAAGNWSYLLYFAALGIGFMLIEIPLIQRLSIYLGSPTYALVVVLFTILLSSGIGSLTTQKLSLDAAPRRQRWAILLLIIVIALYLPLLPASIKGTQQWPFAARISLSAALIFPLGFLMGQPFPLGIKQVRAPNMIPWLWAVNGAASVVGSALATIIALASGFRVVSLVGMLCYGAALAGWRIGRVADCDSGLKEPKGHQYLPVIIK
ncbi:MAG: hypothetical protein B6I34_01405 [Anaerolineaceae bacterium 4572_32.1]|nr:MAG: hypothetical protein B6I34_01405 [Anaerolineaceae bacterium 4572_32.1]